ncbi:MAG TPA: type II secretion system minor pseudopilin GspJ [Sphingomicrobium sp.]|nr:type II secretion system minor pseudopilin GspJ [Sphingomicrobium sp.]
MTVRSPNTPGDAGFTLVEMLVALTIFALLAAAGVGILRASVDTQSAVDQKLAEVGAVGRLHALLASDLGQAALRPTRDSGGERPAFIGDARGMQLVRAGWSNPDGEARSNLQRVEWRFEPAGLARIGHRRLDGGDDGQPAILARSLDQVAFRYRSLSGDWTSVWQSTPAEPLPAAVELSLQATGQAALRIVVALPPRGSEPVPSPAAGELAV